MTSQEITPPDSQPGDGNKPLGFGDFLALGQRGYNTYFLNVNGVSAVDGTPLLPWEQMSEKAQRGWAHAACAIVMEARRFTTDRRGRLAGQPPVPRINGLVHYVSFGTPKGEFVSECRAATITEIDTDAPLVVGLAAINPTGVFFRPLVAGGCRWDGGGIPDHGRPHVRAYPGGTWHWAEACTQ